MGKVAKRDKAAEWLDLGRPCSAENRRGRAFTSTDKRSVTLEAAGWSIYSEYRRRVMRVVAWFQTSF